MCNHRFAIWKGVILNSRWYIKGNWKTKWGNPITTRTLFFVSVFDKMYSLFVILTVLSVVCGETTIKVLDTVEALSVDPVNCNYSEEVCGPFYSGIKVTKGGKDWLFTSFGLNLSCVFLCNFC